MKVFLGGSLNPTIWRQDVAIPTLERAGINYCVPGNDGACHACDCDTLLYVVDRQTRSLKTCAQAIQDSMLKKRRVVLVVQHLIAGTYIDYSLLGQEETKQFNEFRDSVASICLGLGAAVFSEVEDAVRFIVEPPVVADKNGVEIAAGQTVLVHNDEGTREAVVVEPLPGSPTVNAPGHWVDVNIENQGTEGMPSYILEVTDSGQSVVQEQVSPEVVEQLVQESIAVPEESLKPVVEYLSQPEISTESLNALAAFDQQPATPAVEPESPPQEPSNG